MAGDPRKEENMAIHEKYYELQKAQDQLLARKNVKSRTVEWFLILMGVVLGIAFNNLGLPGLLPPHVRAEMALRCGADIVLQLPYAFSVREAEFFALGGVYILNAIGCVTHLSFGSETEDLSLLQQLIT